ncbi:hypothetical protein [Sulfitobacter sp. JB4-11]|uniref:hypothetical protein n=1 Tax=Sulfitobacter rhodophyticola TaxID=3238304 RepID=UPI0035150CF7
MNDWFSGSVAKQLPMQLRQKLCCERTQQELNTSAMGSSGTFATLVTIGRIEAT